MEGVPPKSDYEEYQDFLKKFTSSIDPDDQLPIRVSNYTITESEFQPEVINFARQYLQDNDCPTSLLNAIVNDVLLDVQDPSKESPLHSGFEAIQNNYQPLKLMQAVISKVNTVCTRLLDNAELMKLMPENCLPAQDIVGVIPKYAALGVKNSRRKMEDRHVVIQDFHKLYAGKKSPRCSYYALFDGHGGAEAAIYGVAHLGYFLRNSISYPDDPENAITDAFIRTDQAVISKYQTDSLRSGTTALVVLHFPEDKMMHVAWAGDSQALIVKNGETVQVVNSHKANRKSERERIEKAGGEVFPLQGIYRVMGQLAITRAIGDADLKPFITSEPEIVSFELDGDEDFLIMASDGLWDGVTEDAAASEVYNRLKEDPDCYETIPKKLVQLAKEGSSSDNITVIVIYLKEPSEIAKFSWPADHSQPLDNMETTTTNDPMAVPMNENAFGSYNFENSNQEHFNGMNMNGSTTTTTTTTTTSLNNNKFIDESMNMEFDGNENLLNFESQTTKFVDDLMNNAVPQQLDNEFGPETDVDAVDEAMLMSSPHSVSQEDDQMLAKEFQQLEQKEIDFAESAPANPFLQENMFGLPKEVLGGGDDETEPVLDSVPLDGDNETGAGGAVVSDEDLAQGSGQENELLDVDASGESQNEIVATTVVAAGAATNVDSEGESDDEWNYVKPASDKQTEENGEEEGDDKERVPAKEQHAEAQAIAESQEHCAELNFEQSGVETAPETEQDDQSALPQVEQEFERVEAGSPDHLLQPAEEKSAEEEGGENTSLLLTVDTTAEHEQAPLSLEIVPAVHVEAEEDMSSQLNPDALEFVPLSPQSSAPVSPSLKMDLDMDEQFKSMQPPPLIAAIMDNDRILAQSPRKNNTAQLDNVPMPDENEFDIEISNRPHELSVDFIQSNGGAKKIDLNGSAVSNGESEASHHAEEADVDDEDAGALNSKEERDLDEEKEELRDEVIKEIIDNISNPEELNGHGADDLVAAVPGEQDPMNMSFHQDVQMAPSANPFDLNAVQLLPNDDIEEEDERSAKGDYNERPEVEQRMEQLSLEQQAVPEVVENPLPEADFAQAAPETEKPMELTESESNFYMQQPEEEPERKEFDEKEEEALHAAADVKVETPPPTPAAVNDVQVQDLMQATSPEPQKLVEAVEKLAEVESVVADQKSDKPLETEVAIVATLGVVAGAAVALTAAAAANPGAKKPAAIAAKSKTPNTVGVKPNATSTKATPTKMASPSLASRITPTAASRTTASKASPAATTRSPMAEKKTLPAITPTSAAKRTPSRPSTASSLSGASPKPSTTTRLSTSARTPTSLTSPKPPTTSRLSATKTTSATTTAAAAKKPTTTSSAGLASRSLAPKTTTTTAAARAKTAVTTTTTTTVKKTTVTSSLMSAKPKTSTTTSSTTTSSRLMNGLKAAPTASSRLSTTKTTPTTRAPLSATRPASTTATSAAPIKKGPTPGSASARASAVSAPSAGRLTATARRVPGKTTTTKTAAAPVPAKGSKPQPITKRNNVVESTTVVVVENGSVSLNGDGPKELMLNGNGADHDVVVNGGGKGYGDGAEAAEGQKMVIDLTAD